jgi:hypothetical protein
MICFVGPVDVTPSRRVGLGVTGRACPARQEKGTSLHPIPPNSHRAGFPASHREIAAIRSGRRSVLPPSTSNRFPTRGYGGAPMDGTRALVQIEVMNATLPSLLALNPRNSPAWRQPLSTAIAALSECAQACLACADACLSEDHSPQLRRCIRLDQNCATICHATASVLHRQTELAGALVHDLLRACVSACRECGEECRRHATQHEHCRVCADFCLQCQEACNELLGTVSPAGSLR